MIVNSESLKSKIKNKSKKVNVSSEILLKIFMFERLLIRIAASKYKNNFILKGGFLISSIFGINLRSTVDIDATIKGLFVSRESLEDVIKKIIEIKVDDGCVFEIVSIKDIRMEDIYNGYQVVLKISIDKIWSFINIDITTGDQITYREVQFNYKTILEENNINLLTYNNETIIAEKFETIISRGIFNTRMKDYYDLYMFVKLKINEINKKTLIDAINNTAKRRNTLNFIFDSNNIIKLLEDSKNIKKLWKEYQLKFEYAASVDFFEVIDAVKFINNIVSINK